MCYNCGCQIKDDDMGDKHNIVIDDLAMAAIASKEDGAETLTHIKELIAKTTPEELDKRIKELKQKHEEAHQQGEEHHHDN
jgi:hypothetical protein